MKHTFERYCKDYKNIENYYKAAADNFKGWHCHHRLQTWTSDGERRPVDITVAELKALGMYYNRPASELIFLTSIEHKSLHIKEKHYMLGKKFSEETKKKMSESHKGRVSWNKGKHHTEETKNKMSEAHKGKKLSEETKRRMSKPKSEETKRRMSEARKNMSEETKKKIGAAKKGTCWFNNGEKCVRAKECPQGFVPGRLS